MARVSLQNVCKIYAAEKGQKGHAVRDFHLDVADREFVVLVGPSGCGKSSTLRMIAGLEDVSSGEISIGNKVVNQLAPQDRDIAMVFQNYALYPHLSVYENMAFSLKLRKIPQAQIQRRVQEAAAILGITEYLDRKPMMLSGGQRQRVAVGRAMVRQPKVFLFDEPLSNLDAKLRGQMRTEIIQLHQRLQATMIYVTHDQVEAMTMADRIVVMAAVENPETGGKEGVIQQIGEPLKIYHEPVNLFVAGFIGSPPMNFIHGTLRLIKDALVFQENQNGPIQLNFTDLPAARAFVNREIILGVRPEDVVLVSSEGKLAPGTFPAIADVIEALGAETHIHLQTGVQTCVCRTQLPVDQRELGHRMRFQINAAKAHLFDPATTKRLC
ncbi:MAG: sn-glycerol-3-phosphate ABC transporter ATP-binding protein UgpC [Chthoniobacterales bacterium]